MKFSFLKFCAIVAVFTPIMLKAQNSATHIFDPELNQLVVRQEKKTPVRSLRYHPDGEDFVIINGKKRFNRALYGTNTGFRVETGDVPEFALYLPRMGGNLSFQLQAGNIKIPLNDAQWIESRYRPGARIYSIKDPVLGKGHLEMWVLAMADAEGMIIRVRATNIPSGIKLLWKFGGAADRRFSREGDLGVDPPDSFDLKREYCTTNVYTLRDNKFDLRFGANQQRQLYGVFPEGAILTIDPAWPLLEGELILKPATNVFMAIQIPDQRPLPEYQLLSTVFDAAEASRKAITSSLKIHTPDPYFNTLGGAISAAADGIWDGKVWMHGAIGWRMPLNGWRAAYTGDVMGWHDRARTHFDAYAASQVVDVAPVFSHPNQDSALNLARSVKTWGTQMYSTGYICRNPERNDQMHHYDMNLAYIDELLWHFNWTGDLEYVRKMWPVLTRHLAWEKRNFDPDGDGLYNAYACIWASDALYYNSGGVTHSSAYNYRSNKMAADIAVLLGEDPTPYRAEARKILKAINQQLWLQPKGHWAEFKDFMGEQIVHESAAIWSIYHAIDSEVHDPLQAYQATRYVDTEIPHIPLVAEGIEPGKYHTISTTNWLPYSWSINNVAIAEVTHMALAYWQSGRYDRAFNLLKSSMLDNMYLGSSPGNLGQISYYDAARGECYRDFGDPVGITSRTVVQGLFGILPDAMHGKLLLRPGFPAEWDHASIETATIRFSFKRNRKKSTYEVHQKFRKPLATSFVIPVSNTKIRSVKVNGKKVQWKSEAAANGHPMIRIDAGDATQMRIEVVERGKAISNSVAEIKVKKGQPINYKSPIAIVRVFDPQQVMSDIKIDGRSLIGFASGVSGHRTFFIELKQGAMKWIQPVHVEITEELAPIHPAFMAVNTEACEMINIDEFLNDSVSKVFKNEYLSPRSPYTTLQIPIQGIGEWCHPTLTADIDDSGLRAIAKNDRIITSLGVPFRTPAAGHNIAFTSHWDNFPLMIDIPLSGKAKNAYLMMAGTTNHMQCHLDNGYVIVNYTDNSSDTLRLINPENWCPIEQDFYVDDIAFRLKAPRPYRIHLKTGLVSNQLEQDLKIDGVYGRRIPGGAGVLLDMPLDQTKTLKNMRVQTRVNEVIIGLMGLTLQR